MSKSGKNEEKVTLYVVVIRSNQFAIAALAFSMIRERCTAVCVNFNFMLFAINYHFIYQLALIHIILCSPYHLTWKIYKLPLYVCHRK